MSTNIEIMNDKYTIIKDDNGVVTEVLRHGELWRNVLDDDVIGGLVHELEKAWELNDKLIEVIEQSGVDWEGRIGE